MKQIINLIKRHWILSIILLIFTVSIAVPLAMRDGTQNFQGQEKTAAKEGIQDFRELFGHGTDLISTLGAVNYYAEKVQLVETTGNNNCKNNGGVLYEVTLTTRTIFWIPLNTYQQTTCIALS